MGHHAATWARFVAPLIGLWLGAASALATETDPVGSLPDLRGGEPSLDERRSAREAELESIRRTIGVSERRQAALGREIEAIEEDRATLNAELIATAQRLRQTEEAVREGESRLEQLSRNEAGLRLSLRERRAVMADVLMALQRMGRTPPPALLSRPEDALAAIRGSILAGAVLPDIRAEAETLAADLSELKELSARIRSEQEALKARYASLGEEQVRIDLLVASKRQQREQTEAALSAEQRKAADLAGKAETVRSLTA